jgi:phosphate transport system substrate-binding protein
MAHLRFTLANLSALTLAIAVIASGASERFPRGWGLAQPPDPSCQTCSMAVASLAAAPTAPPNTEVAEPPPGQFPGWILAIPVLGGLLWWLLRNKGDTPTAVSPMPVALDLDPSRIILTPRNCRRAYAYWEVSDQHRARERDRGGRTLMLRLFDVTGRDLERHPPVRIDQFEVTENQPDLHVPIPADDRDYRVELGYVTSEGHWLPLAQSDPVRVPACVDEVTATPQVALE